MLRVVLTTTAIHVAVLMANTAATVIMIIIKIIIVILIIMIIMIMIIVIIIIIIIKSENVLSYKNYYDTSNIKSHKNESVVPIRMTSSFSLEAIEKPNRSPGNLFFPADKFTVFTHELARPSTDSVCVVVGMDDK